MLKSGLNNWVRFKHLESIFLPFFTTKAAGEGTGLGLSITCAIVHGLGGGIQVQSTPGVGTTFKVFLPLATHPVSTDQPQAARPAQGRERILLVDDETPLLEVLGAGLQQLGYSVLPFNSPTQALEVFRAVPFVADLVVTDYTMPGLTGFDLAREVLKVRPELKVVVMSGYAEQATEAQAREIGCSAFLAKPIVAKTLAQTIRALLDPGAAR